VAESKGVSRYTEIPPDVARAMKLSIWSTDLNKPTIELIAHEAQHFEFVEEKQSVDELIWSEAPGQG
jgi:hypothetical protein